MSYQREFMSLAMAEARAGIRSGHGGPFGAVVAKNGQVVASGHNCVLKDNDSTCHGEIAAIRAAEKKLETFDLSGCELYTMAEPCPMCLGAILWANIQKVYYGYSVEDTASIGYGRAASIIDKLEAKGIVGPELGGNKPREVLISSMDEYVD